MTPGPSPELTATSEISDEEVPEAHATPSQFDACTNAEAEVIQTNARGPAAPQFFHDSRQLAFESKLQDILLNEDAAKEFLQSGSEWAKNTFGEGEQSDKARDFLANEAGKSVDAFAQLHREQNRVNRDQKSAKERQENAKPTNSDPPITKAQAKEAYELGLLALAAYPNEKAPAGWQIVDEYSSEAANLPDRLKPVPDGFRAVLLEKLDRDGKGTGQYVIAFAGTNDSPDWGANTGNAFGYVTAQYDYAVRLTQYLSALYGRRNLSLVGHSLGGGLASTASVVQQIPATVFNPAGVNKFVVLKYNSAADLKNLKAPITVYRVRGEPLTTWQDANLWGPLSWAAPDTLGEVTTLYSNLPLLKWPLRHGMAAVLGALKAPIEEP